MVREDNCLPCPRVCLHPTSLYSTDIFSESSHGHYAFEGYPVFINFTLTIIKWEILWCKQQYCHLMVVTTACTFLLTVSYSRLPGFSVRHMSTPFPSESKWFCLQECQHNHTHIKCRDINTRWFIVVWHCCTLFTCNVVDVALWYIYLVDFSQCTI